jgi:hypothetical protein
VKSFFEKSLTDRIAPIILKASAIPETKDSEYDKISVILSEPVNILDQVYGTEAFSFYLNSATDLDEQMRYRFVHSQSAPQKGKDTLMIRYYRADPQNPSPHAGDYIRFRADEVVWADASNWNALAADSLRPSSDAGYHWNSPTAYNSTKRLPSPWVCIKGASRIPDEGEEDRIEYAEPSFRIKMAGPFEFKIVMDEGVPAMARAYSVLDLQGNVLRQGKINSSETIVKGLKYGSYIVKVGLGHRRVNIR